ncbi:MAG: Polysaccharide biosynthesis protein [Planctomycetes bacterium ADurb.Bin126]|nr:MAG: Polysaccharide biosynthesis protein [Planctomycetes bacterium ADurb.Bin126]
MFSNAMTQATTLVVGIILVRLISRAEYGTFRQATAFYVFLAALLAAELETYLLYLIPRNPAAVRRPLLAQSLLAETLVAGAMCLMLSLGAHLAAQRFNNPDLVPLLHILALLPFFDRVLAMLQVYMIAMDAAQWSALYSLLGAVGKAAVTVGVVATGGSLAAVLTGHVILVAAVAVSALVHAFALSGGGRFHLDRGLIAEAFRYTYPLYLTGMAYTIVLQFDKLIASAFSDPGTFALYAVGALSLPVVPVVVNSMTSATLPPMVKMVSEGQDAEALALWQEGMRKCSLVVFPCFAFFLVAGRDFIILLYGQAYEQSAWVFRVYLALLPLQVAAFGSIFRAKGRTREIAVATGIGAVVSTVVGILLTWAGGGTWIGFVGPAVGVWTGYALFVCILTVRMARLVNVSLSAVLAWRELAASLALSLAVAAPLGVLTLAPMPIPIRLVASACLYPLLLALAAWRFNALRDDEKRLIRSALRLCLFWRRTDG